MSFRKCQGLDWTKKHDNFEGLRGQGGFLMIRWDSSSIPAFLRDQPQIPATKQQMGQPPIDIANLNSTQLPSRAIGWQIARQLLVLNETTL